MTTEEKYTCLKDRLKQMGKVIIAFSGGVDSSFLVKTASDTALEGVLAVTGVSASLPHDELIFARELTGALNIEHRTIATNELQNEDYQKNPPDRCYFCKKDLFGLIREIAAEEHYPYILDGTNADDSGDWRPGIRAAREEGVISPLLEAGLTKDDIRQLSRRLGLSTWNKPATPCLASRFPYGQEITERDLDLVYRAEAFIRGFGLAEFRVRHHGSVARIEIHENEFPLLMEDAARRAIVEYLKQLGFAYITLDLQGFRSGSSNDVLS